MYSGCAAGVNRPTDQRPLARASETRALITARNPFLFSPPELIIWLGGRITYLDKALIIHLICKTRLQYMSAVGHPAISSLLKRHDSTHWTSSRLKHPVLYLLLEIKSIFIPNE